MNSWDNLSMAQRAEVIKLAVQNGIHDLDTIRGAYNEYADGGSIHNNPGMTGMMKAKLATTAHYGNPTARRMANYDGRDYVWSGEYEYDRGIGEPRRGNVYVGSYDNLVTPRIQDTGNGLTYIDNVWSPENDQRSYMQSLKFNNEKDARYFGEHYKEIAPMMSLYSNGGSIHIKPENRGKFTALKERTGHSATWFKEHGTPAQKKMATFALNAAKWHGYGGNLYFEGGPFSYIQRMMSEAQNMSRFARKPSYEEALKKAGERVEKERKDYLTTSSDNTWVEGRNNKSKNKHLKERGIKGAKSHALWEQEHPNLTAWGNVLSATPIAVASAPFVSGVGDALAGTAAGQAATSGLTWLANAAKATPWVASSLPWIEAGLNTLAATEGVKEISEGNFTPMTALELSPLVPPTVGIGNNLYLPHFREHVFASKAPIGYGGIGKAAKEIAEGVLSGKRANIDTPAWFNSNAAKQLQEYAYVPDYIQGAEREQYLKDFGERALKARTDMWRLYNRLPQKYNTFSPSKRHPGAYTASEDIEALKWVPQPDERYYGVDFVNSVGGNTGRPTVIELGRGIPDEGEISKKFGVTIVSDLFDLHPFSRPNDRIISRLQRTWNKAVRRPLNKIGDKIWKMSGNHLYDTNEIKKYIDANKNDEFAMEMFDPDMFPRVGIRRKIGELLRKEAENIMHDANAPKFEFLKPIDKKIADFEIGRLINGRPIMVKNDVPWTADTRIISTPEKDADFVTTYTQGFNSDNLFPSEVDDWRKGINRININDLNNWITNDVLKGITKSKKNKHGLD